MTFCVTFIPVTEVVAGGKFIVDAGQICSMKLCLKSSSAMPDAARDFILILATLLNLFALVFLL